MSGEPEDVPNELGRRRFLALPVAGALAVALGGQAHAAGRAVDTWARNVNVGSSGPEGHVTTMSHVTPGPGNGRQFVWPVSSWVSATDYYPTGSHHNGSADLTAPHYAVVYPARPGTVTRARFSSNNYQVVIRHEGQQGQLYFTSYVHMADQPLVSVGDDVGLSTPLGYVGRTGSAYWAGPHVHFSIRKDTMGGPPFSIPGFEIGDWVDVNEFIPGEYEGLSPIQQPSRLFDVRVTAGGMRAYATTGRQTSGRLADLDVGDVYTVRESRRGQYRVELDDGQLGWIAHSGTAPADSQLFPVRVTGSGPRDVRRTPSASGELIGVHDPSRGSADRYLLGYGRGGTSDSWRLVLWRCTEAQNRSDDPDDRYAALGGCPHRVSGQSAIWKYGWMAPGDAEDSDIFHSRTRIDGLNVYGNKVVDGQNWPDTSNKIDEYGASRALVLTREVKNGWYRTVRGGEIAWTRGWFTGGPH
ncbi:M23 family metallopeptidase [Phytoactinopolyspora limicola]|uniref:M23 family metallopeptidase n=1 Tax=Phytoactinopolyspora limicola TaxID=2715536 RepID=UPI00140B2A9C|nr:M23 family metallopeptidase [Phytoactinopolyspora limicola]